MGVGLFQRVEEGAHTLDATSESYFFEVLCAGLLWNVMVVHFENLAQGSSWEVQTYGAEKRSLIV